MSAASRQRTCACCGKEIGEDDRTDVEPMMDPSVRYVAVLSGHSTFTRKATIKPVAS